MTANDKYVNVLQDVIHTLKEFDLSPNARHQLANLQGHLRGQERLITELEAQLEAAKNQWIPVSERLPKEGESVFVYSKYGQSDMADFIGGAWENCWLIDDADETITHWCGKPPTPAIQTEGKA